MIVAGRRREIRPDAGAVDGARDTFLTVSDGTTVNGLAVLGTGHVPDRHRVDPGVRLRRDEQDGEKQAAHTASGGVPSRAHAKVVRPACGAVKARRRL